MKPLLLLVILSISTSAFSQSVGQEVSLGYAYAAPLGGMKKNIRNGNGVVMSYHIQPPNSRFMFGAELNYSIYGHDKDRKDFVLDDGTTAAMDVVVNNSYINLLTGSKFQLTNRGAFRPYLNAKAGYSWFNTDLNIYDPDDSDHCAPVESEVLMNDGSFIYSLGGGVMWDLSSIFKRWPQNTFYFNLSANFTAGGKVDYMNTDAPSQSNPSSNEVYSQFINTQTQVVHEHHVGNVYSSFIEIVEIRGSFVFRRN